jgi:hypothetical protein
VVTARGDHLRRVGFRLSGPLHLDDDGTDRLLLFERTTHPLLFVLIISLEERVLNVLPAAP